MEYADCVFDAVCACACPKNTAIMMTSMDYDFMLGVCIKFYGIFKQLHGWILNRRRSGGGWGGDFCGSDDY